MKLQLQIGLQKSARTTSFLGQVVSIFTLQNNSEEYVFLVVRHLFNDLHFPGLISQSRSLFSHSSQPPIQGFIRGNNQIS